MSYRYSAFAGAVKRIYLSLGWLVKSLLNVSNEECLISCLGQLIRCSTVQTHIRSDAIFATCVDHFTIIRENAPISRDKYYDRSTRRSVYCFLSILEASKYST